MEDLKNTIEHKNKTKITYGSMNNKPFYGAILHLLHSSWSNKELHSNAVAVFKQKDPRGSCFVYGTPEHTNTLERKKIPI